MTTNKKIIGATAKEYNGIKFKSKLEVTVYSTLLQEGFKPKYEEEKFIVWKGFKPTVPFYNKDKVTRLLKIEDVKVRDITYTPDFTFEYKDTLIVIEAKGFENDTFPIKKKLFRKYLEKNRPSSLYFEIYTKKQLMQAISIIKAL